MSRYKLKLHLRNAVPEIIALVNNDKDLYFVHCAGCTRWSPGNVPSSYHSKRKTIN